MRIDDERTFDALAAMYHEGRIDHIQVQVVPERVPESEQAFRDHLNRIADADVRIVIHAPHHGHGVNPCAPGAYEELTPAEAAAWTETALARTAEAADRTAAGIIVLHAGRYYPGRKAEAEATFAAFLDDYFDRRFVLENLPSVYADYPLLGNDAGELLALGGGRIRGFCLDFAHLFCTANYRGVPYGDLLAPFDGLDLRLFHLSNSRKGSITDEHLPLDHPEGGLDFKEIVPFVARHPDIDVSLEYKENDPRVYDRQLPIFDALFRRWRPTGANTSKTL